MELCFNRTHLARDCRWIQTWASSVVALFFLHRRGHKHRAIVFSLPGIWHMWLICMSLLWNVISVQETTASKDLRLVNCVYGTCLCCYVFGNSTCTCAQRSEVTFRCPVVILYHIPQDRVCHWTGSSPWAPVVFFLQPHSKCWDYGHVCPRSTVHIHGEGPNSETHTLKQMLFPMAPIPQFFLFSS